ncbi:hypothetical protein DOTSEDRAFT_39195 [Dothistroma septosporum NZE10]|uniref:Uncharacterized protein n=1 Tax=Dothistroma septosporum (strain NZE10 / CBS 128990) TaxID=675120 RepID=M2WJ56_DOTSN|nr:hypothetical protein DOTSEDRAFT_39195 [Dothistroma septosporum NZE10]
MCKILCSCMGGWRRGQGGGHADQGAQNQNRGRLDFAAPGATAVTAINAVWRVIVSTIIPFYMYRPSPACTRCLSLRSIHAHLLPFILMLCALAMMGCTLLAQAHRSHNTLQRLGGRSTRILVPGTDFARRSEERLISHPSRLRPYYQRGTMQSPQTLAIRSHRRTHDTMPSKRNRQQHAPLLRRQGHSELSCHAGFMTTLRLMRAMM